MSRVYECYCHRCQKWNARSESLESGKKLFQCMGCGMCWIEVTTVHELRRSGIDQNTWKLSMEEAYETIDKWMARIS